MCTNICNLDKKVSQKLTEIPWELATYIKQELNEGDIKKMEKSFLKKTIGQLKVITYQLAYLIIY